MKLRTKNQNLLSLYKQSVLSPHEGQQGQACFDYQIWNWEDRTEELFLTNSVWNSFVADKYLASYYSDESTSALTALCNMFIINYYHPILSKIELCRHILVKIPKLQFKENNFSIYEGRTCRDLDGQLQTDRNGEYCNSSLRTHVQRRWFL